MFKPTVIKKTDKKNTEIDISAIEACRVRHTDIIPPPDVVLSIKGEIVATRKNFFCITGKAKVGKSFLMTLINSIVLKKGNLNNTLESYLPKGKDKVLYIDTEQSRYHVGLILKRVAKIVEEHKLDNLLMYQFKSKRRNERYEFTKFLANNTKGVGLLIIDGIADLVSTVNDEIEANNICDDLFQWAENNDIAIACVLHQNPTDSAKMRGHLGTIMTNKAETVIQIESSKDNDSVKLVSTTQTRNKKPEEWSFVISDDGIPEIMDEIYTEPIKGRKTAKIYSDDEILEIIKKVYYSEQKGAGFGYTAIWTKITQNESIGISKAKEMVTYAKEIGIIYQDDKKYFLK